ncbi:THUMP-like domain-containing protein [Corynebacterium uberis]|uniref:THUMP-like domain-containing protein n=1 Tax=Corynebacterium TaxID=1716 RepID=UPI001D0B8DA6|nr:SAM-dependent methyltransferase [Corynebacterium uberis]MCZ9309064.1 SAM-dependent methyltransferase [Corynebacterium sp. c6VSa_13]UDL74471.1 SAM-dependent methyltransferase [Corynebacterium uberis]UDL76694.1 SAM-dependent methyltransferase [Corynebacterium uberis]UDL78907.1 SAM-dependent methyltransferase [Corynebacterium uberis]UDL81185.1 SAM-dependent methyltransferase [Corynebacterium uberis]
MAFRLDEVEFLVSHRSQVAQVCGQLSGARADALADAAVLRSAFGPYARAAAEWNSATATGKLPAGWLADHDAAQQATPAPVAQVRAQRLAQACPGAVVHDVTCSVGAEAPAVQAAGLGYIGSDIDASRVAMARHNVSGGLVCRADATTASSSAPVIIADPARRRGGRRLRDPEELDPPLSAVVEAWRGRHLAIKCAPGIDYADWEGLVSVVSVDGGVKEACLYSPGLSAGLRREAVVIRAGQVDRVTDADGSEVAVAPPGRFIIDPDGAVVRAGLVRHFAAREGLWMLDERIAHLSGDRIPVGYRGFPFIEQAPVRKAREVLRRLDVGRVEILVRGVDVDPDVLRRQWRLRGSQPATVVISRIGRSAVALVCGPAVVRRPG